MSWRGPGSGLPPVVSLTFYTALSVLMEFDVEVRKSG